MSTPEEAVQRARAAAAQHPAEGRHPSPAPDPAVTSAKLMEWAAIEPDAGLIRSTRRFGAPVTALKRGLLRLLLQYHTEQNAQQTRFNANVAAKLRQLEERIEALERER